MEIEARFPRPLPAYGISQGELPNYNIESLEFAYLVGRLEAFPNQWVLASAMSITFQSGPQVTTFLPFRLFPDNEKAFALITAHILAGLGTPSQSGPPTMRDCINQFSACLSAAKVTLNTQLSICRDYLYSGLIFLMLYQNCRYDAYKSFNDDLDACIQRYIICLFKSEH